MGEAPCSELEIRRAQVADVARGILEQRIRLDEGARALAALQPDVDPGEEDPELRFFREIARHLGDEQPPRELVARACHALVVRYGAPS